MANSFLFRAVFGKNCCIPCFHNLGDTMIHDMFFPSHTAFQARSASCRFALCLFRSCRFPYMKIAEATFREISHKGECTPPSKEERHDDDVQTWNLVGQTCASGFSASRGNWRRLVARYTCVGMKSWERGGCEGARSHLPL